MHKAIIGVIGGSGLYSLAGFTPTREERHRLQRILSHLHFVRTALLDPESPLAALNRNRPVRPQPGASS